ncbi:MAG: hypothetical protein ABJF01_01475 [bacterium]
MLFEEMHMVVSVAGRRVVAGAVLVLAAACSLDTDPLPTGLDVGAVLSEMTGALPLQAVLQLTDGTAAFHPASIDLSGCNYVAASQAFICSPIATTLDGLTSVHFTTTRSISFADLAGHVLASADAATVASVHVITTTTGTSEQPGISTKTFSRVEDLTLSGRTDGTHVIDGIAVATSKVEAAISLLNFTTADTTRFVNLTLATGTSVVPIAGTVTDDQTRIVTATNVASLTHVGLTFDGSTLMGMVRTKDGTSSSCKINLAAVALQTC